VRGTGPTLSSRCDDEAFGRVEERHGDVRQGHLLVVAKTERGRKSKNIGGSEWLNRGELKERGRKRWRDE
jgi:hypothetical protein